MRIPWTQHIACQGSGFHTWLGNKDTASGETQLKYKKVNKNKLKTVLMSGSQMCHEENLSSIRIEKWFYYRPFTRIFQEKPLWGNDIGGTAVK